MATPEIFREHFAYTSNLAADSWCPRSDPKAFEWWYFDALSEDGRDAVVVIFLDNFIFSPRYNAANRKNPNGGLPSPRFPAVAFSYYRDGVPVYRAISEFPEEDFSADTAHPSCQIGGNSFTLKSAPYGSGYFVNIDIPVNKDRHLEAHFEWLSIESDFMPEKTLDPNSGHTWNMVVSRSDVTGRITVTNPKKAGEEVVYFRGTGYHDHNSDNRWLPETVSDWQWGRAHFADSTAVFYRYRQHDSVGPITKLFTVIDGCLEDRDTTYEESSLKRDKFGIKYPTCQRFTVNDEMGLVVKNDQVIDSSFFYLRFLSEMQLSLPDGRQRTALGITEYLAPATLRYRWLDWLVNMRIGRNGKSSFLP